MRRAPYRTELGTGYVACDRDRVVAITLPAQPAPECEEGTPPPAVAALLAALEAYYAGEACLLPSADLVDAAGTTPLSRAIYDHVSQVRPGATETYAAVAAAVGRPGAARAVGAAMARNPFAPVIPCHRVVGGDGSLRGYRGGLHQKEALLRMEAMAGG